MSDLPEGYESCPQCDNGSLRGERCSNCGGFGTVRA